MDARLDAADKATGFVLGRSGLALAAIEAVLAAVERDRGVVLPIAFDVMRVPARRTRVTPAELIANAKARQAATRETSERRDDSQAEAGRSP